jgi:hypothetical protein
LILEENKAKELEEKAKELEEKNKTKELKEKTNLDINSSKCSALSALK